MSSPLQSPIQDERAAWSFIRELFESNKGEIHPGPRPHCVLQLTSVELLHDIASFCRIPCVIHGSNSANSESTACATWYDTNCIDLLGCMYASNHERQLATTRTYQRYLQLVGTYQGHLASFTLPECSVYRAHPDAVIPFKSKTSDVGYDLTILTEQKRLTSIVAMYDTGIILTVDNGFYAEIVARSSLCKSGYMLANGTGIIDRSYTGTLKVALAKIDPDAPDIVLPFRCCQIIFRQQVHAALVEREAPVERTARGDGGFGSTS
ncbi:Deoxyuridine 5'-triphosphate nucleotidohydrolase [Tetrabaena socialis]|uniref:dUTP diphosphatase n=1 Tax=Tetrabaena socialis TaxID=47790 RepID=A0A2J8A016_9CHLO|nr:Deoxyuridine 5'-triphosphate nucleotidohydrolase [Tetrabaena socialis]|eukprot:PNH05846.1 Deoxyuridine 5'-triphosphate nucleotidohydrolase [Tetrabaena socialis]